MSDLLPFISRLRDRTDLLLAFMHERAVLTDSALDFRFFAWYIHDLAQIFHDLEDVLSKGESHSETATVYEKLKK